MLSDLEHSRRTIEREQAEIRAYKEELETLRRRTKEKQEKLDAQKERIIRDANEKAERILQSAKDYADETMRNFRKFGKENISASEMEKEREKLRQRMAKTSSKVTLEKAQPKKAYKPSDFKLGTSVRVLSMNLTGTVHTLPDSRGNVEVQMGILRSKVPITDLDIIEETASKQTRRTSSGKMKMGKSLTVSPEINLIGRTSDEAVALLDKYLDDAYLAHLSPVRVVHGKGTGALRNAVHQYLKRQKHVKSYRLGAFGEGDAGVTIVEFK